jgi:hypothetical protein
MIIKLHDGAGHPVLVNTDIVALIQQDEDGETEILFAPEGIGNLFVTETVEEVEALIRPA